MDSKRSFRIALTLTALSVLAISVGPAFAQGMGPGMGSGMGRGMYDPNTETTINGTIQEVKTISPAGGWGGTHLDVKTDSGNVDVHVGPSHFVASKGFHLDKGEKIEVTGSKATFEGHEAVIAREIKSGGKTLTLRNSQGIPEWSGGHRAGGR